ncbi:MAG: hypothetical protein HYV02_02530 [Deltaproteobacteria bacterium]|nr:hypothetical protein [Deltaproteobacteria bacterium]
MVRRWFGIAGLLALLVSAGCLFGPSRGPKILGYQHGTVLLTTGERYQVGPLTDEWLEERPSRHVVGFRDRERGAIITTSAWCGAHFEDLPLTALMGHLFAGIELVRVDPAIAFSLDGRGALRTRSLRRIDGVVMQTDAVVVKKDGCNFDFYLIARPEDATVLTPVFERFVHGFRFH